MSAPPTKRQRARTTRGTAVKDEVIDSPQRQAAATSWLKSSPQAKLQGNEMKAESSPIKNDGSLLSPLVDPYDGIATVDSTLNNRDSPPRATSRPRRQKAASSPIPKLEDPTSESPSETTKSTAKRKRASSSSSSPSKTKESKVPPHFFEQYNLIREMRNNSFGVAFNAPVDTMGCAALAKPSSSPKDQRFQTLVSLMLSSQTKDAVTSDAVERLHTTLPGGLSVPSVLAAESTVVHECIRRVSFHNTKLKNILKTAQILQDEYDGDIPSTIEGLLKLPGVGPKMGHLCMQAAHGENTGIGVDTHVHRLANMFNWVKTKTPEQTREELESWLPKPLWQEINTLLVGIGQTICPARTPKCGSCLLAENLLCPKSTVKHEMRQRQKEQEKIKSSPDACGDQTTDIEDLVPHHKS